MSSERLPDITSPGNRWIKLARSLHRRKQRYRERAILVEGVRPVHEALDAGADIRVILTSADVSQDSEPARLALQAVERGLTVLSVEPSVFKQAADTETPQGVLAVCAMPNVDRDPDLGAAPLVLIVDQVRDPGNLGTLLRSALGTGVDAVYIGPESADPFSPKVIRAGVGSHFRIPIRFLDWVDMPEALKRCRIYATEALAPIDYDDVDWTEPTAIVIGNETSGVSEAAFQHVHGRLGIPLASSLESLNAGIAGSVILFEAWRQRRMK